MLDRFIPDDHPVSHVRRLLCLSVCHRRVSAADRGRFALTTGQQDALHAVIREHVNDAAPTESLVLSTCNRTEVYIAGPADGEAADAVRIAIGRVTGLSAEDLARFRAIEGEAAARHLCRLAAGLESVVVGETQIVSQLRQAFTRAAELGRLGPALHSIVHQAFRVSRRVRAETSISDGRVSAPSVAVSLAASTLDGGLDGRVALVIGAGKMARLAAEHLVEAGAGEVVVANRTRENAAELAANVTAAGAIGRTVSMQRIAEQAAHADVIVSAVGRSAGDPFVLTPCDLAVAPQAAERPERAMRATSAPRVVIDLSIPASIDPAVAACVNVTYFGVDDLADASASGRQRRSAEVPTAEAIIDEEMRGLFDAEAAIRAGVLKSLFRHFADVSRCEAVNQAAHTGEENLTEKQLYEFSRRLVRKLLAPLTTRAKVDPDALDQADLHTIAVVFGLAPDDPK